MTIVRDIIDFVEELSGHPLRGDEGVHRGEETDEVSGITVSWMATPDAIRDARSHNNDLLLSHESLFFPYGSLDPDTGPEGWADWPINKQRMTLLDNYGITSLRVHGSLDDICILDDFAVLLGLGAPVVDSGLTKIYEIDECTLDELVDRVKNATGMPALRVSGPQNSQRTIKRIGLPWGGLGLFVNVGYQQSLIDQSPDAFISGESDNYGFRFAQESGIPTIETSHEVSENPGLEHFTDMLANKFPAIRCTFYENQCIWRMS